MNSSTLYAQDFEWATHYEFGKNFNISFNAVDTTAGSNYAAVGTHGN